MIVSDHGMEFTSEAILCLIEGAQRSSGTTSHRGKPM